MEQSWLPRVIKIKITFHFHANLFKHHFWKLGNIRCSLNFNFQPTYGI